MLKFLGVLIVAAVILKFDYKSVQKSQSKRDNVIYISVFTIALSLILVYLFDVSIPNPAEAIKQLYKPVAEPYSKLLENNHE